MTAGRHRRQPAARQWWLPLTVLAGQSWMPGRRAQPRAAPLYELHEAATEEIARLPGSAHRGGR